MKQVRDIVAKFGVSRPVIRLKVDDDGSDVSAYTASPLYQFEPEQVPNCVITELVNSEYTERFSLREKSYTIDTRQITYDAVGTIRGKIKQFLYKNLEMKNPYQSKVYKWTDRYMPQDDDFNEVILSLYKYLRTICNEDMIAFAGKKPEIDNIIALLEAMQEKYDRR